MVEEEKTFQKLDIPTAEILEDVAEFLKREGDISAEEGVKRLDMLYKKYKKVEQQLLAQKLRLNAKLPELEESLKVIEVLEIKEKNKEPFSLTYMVSDHAYAKARVNRSDKVLLWLGANVMAEYSLEKARRILETNYDQGMTYY
ncbi:unnamed protein product [Dracunculus medinensis]|uniref:Prefoldin subunit 3 n=1 Tax=Dracunculus medinensis TaxID=318479 RepID=A0A0N4UAI2_DRAME|nr:unnamed protein product [Dracunculus medinensis]